LKPDRPGQPAGRESPPAPLAEGARAPADKKEIVRRYIEAAVNRGELDAIDRWLSPDYRNPLNPAPGSGPARYKQSVAETRAAFPDVEVTFDYMVAEGDLVAYQTTWRATHSGLWRGIAPTGKRVQWRATAFRRIVDDKVVEGWGTYDWLAVLEQLGATVAVPSG
jgi:predicted ester cyclase